MVVYGGAVVCGGVWWCMLMCGGVWWCTVVYGGVRWCMVVCGGVWWCMVVYGYPPPLLYTNALAAATLESTTHPIPSEGVFVHGGVRSCAVVYGDVR